MKYIRRATQADIIRLAEIEVFNYRMNFYPIFRDDEYYFDELRVDRLADEYAQKKQLVDQTLVYDDGVVKGFIRIDGREVKKLFVEPCLQGNRIGSALIEYAVRNVRVDFLWALEKNTRAIAFYERYGFCVSGETRRVDDTPENFVCLRRSEIMERGESQ